MIGVSSWRGAGSDSYLSTTRESSAFRLEQVDGREGSMHRTETFKLSRDPRGDDAVYQRAVVVGVEQGAVIRPVEPAVSGRYRAWR